MAAATERLGMPPKKQAGKAGAATPATTNLFELTLEKNTSYYKFWIEVKLTYKKPDGTEKSLALTTPVRKYEDAARREAFDRVLAHLQKNEQLFKNKELYPDRAASLYSTSNAFPAKKGSSVEETEYKFVVPGEVVKSLEAAAVRVDVTIKPTTWQASTADIARAASADFSVDKEKNIIEVLSNMTNAATSSKPGRFICDGKSRIILAHPEDFGVRPAEFQDRDLSASQKFATVLKKNVKTIEGTNKDAPKAALALDYSLAAVHKGGRLSEKMRPLLQARRLDTLKGMKCKKAYGNGGMITVCGFSSGPLKDVTFRPDENSQPKKVVDYLRATYNLELKEADLPAVLDRKGHSFPAEMLIVRDFERLTALQEGNKAVKGEIVKANAIAAEQRMQAITKMTAGLELSSKAAKGTGVSLPEGAKPIQPTGRQLEPFAIRNDKGALPQKGTEWENSSFFIARPLDKWYVLLVAQNQQRFRQQEDECRYLLEQLVAAAPKTGMRAARPMHVETTIGMPPYIEVLSEAKAKGAAIVFVVSYIDGDHDALKYAERIVGIPTQQVKGATAWRVSTKPSADTVHNILKKLNVKLGGINHILDKCLYLEGTDKVKPMIMGIALDQPESLTHAEKEKGMRPSAPAVIAIGANNGKIECEDAAKRALAQKFYFAESIYYANPREWKEGESQKETLKKIIKEQLLRFKENRGFIPTHIYVYILGVTDAERDKWSNEYAAAFLDAFKSINQKFMPPLFITTVNADGAERINGTLATAAARAPPRGRAGGSQAVGLCVDTVVTNPTVNEFFLNSARALQGTVRTHKYSLVAETRSTIQMDDLEQMTWALAHLHEYSDRTTGLPTPVRVAADAAKRGRTLYNYERKHEFDIDDLNERLGSASHALAGRRTV